MDFYDIILGKDSYMSDTKSYDSDMQFQMEECNIGDLALLPKNLV